VSGWLPQIVVLFKGVHIAGLVLWCGGLMALPWMLSRRGPNVVGDDYRRLRRATHTTYAIIVTPAAVVAVVAGTWLIFFREVFVPWLYAKLFFVAALAAAHAWIGHMVVQVAETPGEHRTPAPYLPLAAILLPVLAILVLVLGKPELHMLPVPEWLHQPRGAQLPFDVPRR
jgi:uncharacterized membrane protein